MDEVELLSVLSFLTLLWLVRNGRRVEAFGLIGYVPALIAKLYLEKSSSSSISASKPSLKTQSLSDDSAPSGTVEFSLLFAYLSINFYLYLTSLPDFAWISAYRKSAFSAALCIVLVSFVSSAFRNLWMVPKSGRTKSPSQSHAPPGVSSPDQTTTIGLNKESLTESAGDTESDNEATLDFGGRMLAQSSTSDESPDTIEPELYPMEEGTNSDVEEDVVVGHISSTILSDSVSDVSNLSSTSSTSPDIRPEPLRRGGVSITSPARVLVATNDVNSEVRISSTISHYGHDVVIVRSGAALMQTAHLQHFDIIIVDLSLPDYDRVQVKELKNPIIAGSPSNPLEPPIILVGLAGDINETIRARCAQEGMSDLISKPTSDLMIDSVIHMVPCESRPTQAKAGPASRSKSLQPVAKRSQLLKMNTMGNFVTSLRTSSPPSSDNKKPAPLTKGAQSQAMLLKKSALSRPDAPQSPPRSRDAAAEEISVEHFVPTMQSVSTEDRLRQENARLHEKIASLKQQLQQTQRTLDAVIPPEYQQHIARNRHLVLGKVACRPLTIMFSDIRNFSRQAESMSVDALMEFVNSWLSFALPPVSTYGGFVDKFIGDSIMCIFAHDDIGNSAVASVNAAVEMMRSLDYMKSLQGLYSCDTGVGINTGKCMMGVLGIETRMEPTVLGDAVNLASRTESLTKKYGTRVLITEHTKAHLGTKESDWVIRLVDHVYVVGKTFPVKLYEIVDGEPLEVRLKKTHFIENGWWPTAIKEFTDGHFEKALNYFQKCYHIYPLDIPCRIYIQRCTENMQPDFDLSTWQAIYPLESK